MSEDIIKKKDAEIDGHEFTIYDMPTIDKMKLDKRVVSLIAPALSGLEGAESLDFDIDFKAMAQAISSALKELSDNDFENLILKLFSNVQYKKNNQVYEFRNKENINKFDGKIMSLYKLAIEVMRFYEFTPFALAADGSAMTKTHSSKGPKKNLK